MTENMEPQERISTLDWDGSPNFRLITQAIRQVEPLPETKSILLEKTVGKVSEMIKFGNLQDLRGAVELLQVLEAKEESGKRIVEDINEILSEVLPRIRIGLLGNIASLLGDEIEIRSAVEKYLINSGFKPEEFTPERVGKICDYRFILTLLKEKGIDRVSSLADLIEAITLEGKIYRFKKAGLLDLLPKNYRELDSSEQDQIDGLFRKVLERVSGKLNQTQKDGLSLVSTLITKNKLSYHVLPGNIEPKFTLAIIDSATGQPFVFTPEELEAIRQMANLLNTKAVRFNKKTNQFEDIGPSP